MTARAKEAKNKRGADEEVQTKGVSESGSSFARMPTSQNRDMGHPALKPTAGPSTTALTIKLREPTLRMTLFSRAQALADEL
jgi:hypothetical protein